MMPHLACFIQTALLPARSLAAIRLSSVAESVFWAVAEEPNCKAAAAGKAERKNDRRDQRSNSFMVWISLSDGSGPHPETCVAALTIDSPAKPRNLSWLRFAASDGEARIRKSA